MNSPALPRVFVSDEDSATSITLTNLLPNVRVELCQSAENFLSASQSSGPCCLVANSHQPGTWSLKDVLPRTLFPVIVVVDSADVPLVVGWMRRGAYSVIKKPLDSRILLDNVNGAVEYAAREYENIRSLREFDSKRIKLSDKEMDVLGLLITGASNKRMANSLGVSVRTIESRRRAILSRLEVGSVAELVRMETLLEVSRRRGSSESPPV